ncbi:hypothetical protein AB0911_13340 [Streptomyces nigra]|uniref:hypothetical protein n=1 Tax=Streptomyces nigra TaxID=1827580 RepID=UPI00345644C2
MSTRLRDALSAALIALSCLLLPCGATAAWAAYGLADTGRYVTAMAPLASDPAVRGTVADALGTGILREVDRRLGGAPGAPEPRTVRPFVRDAADSFTRTDAFHAAWDAGNRVVHEAVLDALRSRRTGPVTVDLAPVTAQVRQRLLDDHVTVARHIPVEHTEVPVLGADELARLRKGYDVLEVAGLWLPVAAGVLAAAGIAVAACRRRAVTATALGTALGGALLVLAVSLGRRLTLADLPEAAHRPAAGAVYDALTGPLRSVAWSLVALGLAVALAARLTGHLSRRLRRTAGPATDPAHRPTRARV